MSTNKHWTDPAAQTINTTSEASIELQINDLQADLMCSDCSRLGRSRGEKMSYGMS